VRQSMVALFCALSLGGCQTRPAAEHTDHEVVVHPGDAMVSAVGTPFYVAFKSVVCLASAVIAVPAAAILTASESPVAPDARRELGDGIRQNCGPPYVLSPYREVAATPSAEYRRVPKPEQAPATGPEHSTPKGPTPLFPEPGRIPSAA
jgi:hypothetical protein